MATVEFRIKNGKKTEVYTSVEITTRHYRNYLVLNAELEKLDSEVEKLDKQLEFIASLFKDVTTDMLLEQTDMSKIYEIFTELYINLVGSVDPKPSN